MKARIIQIGNSKGIRIPKPLLEAAGLHHEVELSLQSGSLVIRPVDLVRSGWADAFTEMAKNGDDAAASDIPSNLSNWDEEEWEWQ